MLERDGRVLDIVSYGDWYAAGEAIRDVQDDRQAGGRCQEGSLPRSA
jgi:hypothetical protein